MKQQKNVAHDLFDNNSLPFSLHTHTHKTTLLFLKGICELCPQTMEGK